MSIQTEWAAVGGSGVGLYVRDTFSIEVLASSDPFFDNTPEFVIFEVRKDQPDSFSPPFIAACTLHTQFTFSIALQTTFPSFHLLSSPVPLRVPFTPNLNFDLYS